MDFDSYDADSVELALDLVNTRPYLRWEDELPDVARLVAFLEEHGIRPSPRPTKADLAAVHELRRRLDEGLAAHDAAGLAAALNGILRDCQALVQLTDHDGHGWHLHASTTLQGWGARLGALCATGLAMVMVESGIERFGICADDSCDTWFIDVSKNVSKRYCCTRCATRSAVAAHRARSRARPEQC